MKTLPMLLALLALAFPGPVATISPHAQVRLDYKGSAANTTAQDTLRLQPNGALAANWRPLAVYPGSADTTPTTAISKQGRMAVGAGVDFSAALVVKPDLDNIGGLAIAPHSATQSGNLLAVRDSGGGAVWAVDSAGVMQGQTNSAKNFKILHRKAQTSAATPNATANTYGALVTVLPAAGYYGLTSMRYVAALSGGTFGSETLTVEVSTLLSDGSQPAVTLTFSAAGVETELSGKQVYDLTLDNTEPTQIRIRVKSSIPSSTATAALKVLARNS